MLPPVKRSAPVNLKAVVAVSNVNFTDRVTYAIMMTPTGKMVAPRNRETPGAFSASHGAVVTTNDAAAPKPRRQPAETAERKTLSGRELALRAPDLDTSSIVSWGV
jgi:hypothetical protein